MKKLLLSTLCVWALPYVWNGTVYASPHSFLPEKTYTIAQHYFVNFNPYIYSGQAHAVGQEYLDRLNEGGCIYF